MFAKIFARNETSTEMQNYVRLSDIGSDKLWGKPKLSKYLKK